MRVEGSWSLLLALSFAPGLALAQSAPAAAAPVNEAAPIAQQPEPPPAPPTPEPPPPAPAPTDEAPALEPAAPAAPPPPASAAPNVAPLDERRPGSGLVLGSRMAPERATVERSPFDRDYDALPLTLEARFGFNARLGSSFDAAAHEELLDTNFALGGYLAWSREFALGLELEHSGLGRVRALSGQNSIDAEYSATGLWLGARVFPIRRERLDVFVNLRVGMVMQHVDVLGTRVVSDSITVPAQSFSCSEWDGPGVGLGGAVGLAYRLSRHFSVLSRVDATGERLSGDQLGTCADGIGSVASVSGTLGLAYEFETAPK